MPEKITYRLYQDNDLPAVLKLWEECSGWGGISEHQFEDWYIKTPGGRCIIIIAEGENGDIIGQEVLIPANAIINGRSEKVVRLSAPILNPSARQFNLRKETHPAFCMIKFGIEIARQQGYTLVYGFPANAWTALLKLFPKFGLPNIEIVSYPCFSISLTDANTYISHENELEVSQLTNEITGEYDQLWKKAVEQFPIVNGINRTANILSWKLGPHTIFEIRCRQSSELKGYIAIKNSGLVVDMLAATEEDLKHNLSAFIYHAHESNPGKVPVMWQDIHGMCTPLMQSILNDIPFSTINFNFCFCCYLLADSIKLTDVAAANWFVMPGD